jgi:hypothetical protein
MSKRVKQGALLGILVVLFLLLVLRANPAAPPANSRPAAAAPTPRPAAPDTEAPAPRGFGRRPEARPVAPDEIPDIDVSAFSRRPDGSATVSRDLFKFKEPPPPPPPKPRPVYIAAGDPRFIGPPIPPPPPPKPQPPAIAFQFTGTFGTPKEPVAAIVEGDKLTLARRGDVVDGKFVIRHVGYESLDVGFVGFPESEVRRIPISPGK